MSCLNVAIINETKETSIFAVKLKKCKKDNKERDCSTCEEEICEKGTYALKNCKELCCIVSRTKINKTSYINIVSITETYSKFNDQIIDFVIKYNETLGIKPSYNSFIQADNCKLNELYSIQ